MIAGVFLRMAMLLAIAQVSVTAQDASLADYRNQIDAIDRQIVDLLNKRAVVVEQVGRLKKQSGMPVEAPARERQVLANVVETGKNGPLPATALRRIYQVILQEMRDWEAAMGSRK